MEEQKTSRTSSDYNKIREITDRDHQRFITDLEIFSLTDVEAAYSLDRALHMQRLIRMLSRNNRSVKIARDLMRYIFTIKDVEMLIGDNEKLLECISSKFKLLHDLSITLKVPM
jgi:hypothetical protein